MENNYSLIMDVNAVPEHIADQWKEIIDEHGVVFYDSKKGDKPFFAAIGTEMKVVDTSTEQGENLMKELKKVEKNEI